MSQSTENQPNKQQPSREEILKDPRVIKLLADSQKKTTTTDVKASSDTPALLAEYAKKLSSEPYTVIPPHHGKDIEEVLQTSIIRRFSDVTYDPVPEEVLKNTELDELAKLKKAMETFDASKYAQPVRRKVILKSSLINKDGDGSSTGESSANAASASNPSLAKEQANSKGKKSAAKSEKSSPTIDPQSSQAPATECVDADIPLLSPSLFLMTPGLSAKQQQLYSVVNDFLSLNHRLPKADGNELEQHAAQSLVELRQELPNSCRHLIQYFASVLPKADLDVAKAEFLEPSAAASAQNTAQPNAENTDKAESENAESEQSPSKTKAEVESNPSQQTEELQCSVSHEKSVTPSQQDAKDNSDSMQTVQTSEQTDSLVQKSEPALENVSDQSKTDNIAVEDTDTDLASSADTIQGEPNTDATFSADSTPTSTKNASATEPEDKESFRKRQLQKLKAAGLLKTNEEKVYLEPAHRTTPVKPATQSKSVDGKTATYTPCKDFIYYKWMFDSIKEGLRKHKDASGEMVSDLELVPTTGSRQFDIGDVFLSNKSYFLVASMGNSAVAYKTKHSTKGQARIRVITDNRNECDLFDSSFRARFNTYPDTRRVIGKTIKGINLMIDIRNKCISYLKEQPVLGYIYVLRSLSQDPILLEYQRTSELLKIGCTTNTIESRIANAEHETTYLEAPVEVLATYECKILTPAQFEKIIHKVLNMRRCNVKLKSKTTGRVYYPEEWFTVSFEVVKEVIERILDGSIVMYKLNPTNGQLIPNT